MFSRFNPSKPSIVLTLVLAFSGHTGVCQVTKTPERRRVLIHVELDVVKKVVRLYGASCVWEDPSKYPPYSNKDADFELELLLPGGRSHRASLPSLGTYDPTERPTKGVVRTAIYTDEDGIGYRVWNKKTNELIGEEIFPELKSPPKIEISGGPVQGLQVKVGRKATSIETLWSTDQGQTWQSENATGTAGEVAIPSRILPEELAVRTSGMLLEVRVMVGLKLYRERFQLDATEKALKAGRWTRLQGEHPPIPQSALITAIQVPR